MELLASRVLAQQLYSRCRESADAYKPFSLSLKRLRNVLEDIEDGVEDSTTSESYNARLNEQVERCHGILIQLDSAMRPQQDTAGVQPPSAEAVLDLKTAIDVACHQLSVAYEAPSTLGSNIGGLQLRLQTNAGSTTTSSHAKSASTSATSCDTRKLSTSSSTWSLVKPESSTGESIVYVASAATSPALTPMYKEEKQVCSSAGLAPSRSPSAWASTFALDPLSIPMDEASAFILSDDSPTTSDRTYLSPTRPWSASIITPLSDAKEAEMLATTESAEREHPAHSVANHPQGLGISTKDPVHPGRTDAVKIHNEVISKTPSAPCTPTNPTASSPSFSNGNGGLSMNQDKTTLSSAKADDDRKSAPTPPARAPPPPPPSPKRPRNASISRYVITNTTHLDDEVTDDSDDETAPAPTIQAPVPTEDIQIGYVALRSPSTSIPVVRVDDSACEAVPPQEQHQSPNSHIAWASASLEQALTTPSEKEVLSNHPPTNTTNAKPPPLPQRPRRYKTVHSTQSASLSVLDSFITQALVDLEGNDRSHTDRKDHKLKQRKSVGDALNVCPSTNQNPSTRRWSWQRRSRSRSELDQTQMPAPPQRQTSYSGSASLGMHSELEERCAKPLPPPPQRQHSHSGLAQLIRDEQAARAPAPIVPQRQRSHSGLAQLIRQDGRSSGLGMRPFMRSSSDLERDAPPPIPPRPAART
ncbi:hypothetical protein LTR10_012817 [Elasticomyces elasticus]|nr:hypothetical protein LTR10_012817 [Elasticomyces elasticus]KAK4978761.1 hypothetical protein LTR42_001261 [Elasticomyces elasticus]